MDKKEIQELTKFLENYKQTRSGQIVPIVFEHFEYKILDEIYDKLDGKVEITIGNHLPYHIHVIYGKEGWSIRGYTFKGIKNLSRPLLDREILRCMTVRLTVCNNKLSK